DAVFKAADTSDKACQAAYDNMSQGCPVYVGNTTFLPPGFNGDFAPLRDDHKACRDWLPEMKQEYESCHKIRDSLVSQEQALLDSFRDVNIFESPDDCTISGTDVLAYYEAMRVHFKNRKDTFWETYYKLENVTENITKFKCIDQEVAYFGKVAECESAQLKLEQTACDLHERTTESCKSLPACHDAKWNTYVEEMSAANGTIQDLKYEYRAIKRIQCLLDAFASDDMDAKIDECINKRHSTDLVNSTCVDNHDTAGKPDYTEPDVCKKGVESILHPDDDKFDDTEFTAKGIEAARCMASCCTVTWYSWTTYGNAIVDRTHYLIDEATNQPASYSSMEDAKNACEKLGSVHCFGIYDTKCDGASQESPVRLIASPGLDLHEVEESSIGSCIIHMKLGTGTTTTTTVVQLCDWEISVSRSAPQQGDFNTEWKKITVKNQAFDEVFRFSGCTDKELDEAEECVTKF
ncbi:AMY1.6, partial [Symbiodinium pilosum]